MDKSSDKQKSRGFRTVAVTDVNFWTENGVRLSEQLKSSSVLTVEGPDMYTVQCTLYIPGVG